MVFHQGRYFREGLTSIVWSSSSVSMVCQLSLGSGVGGWFKVTRTYIVLSMQPVFACRASKKDCTSLCAACTPYEKYINKGCKNVSTKTSGHVGMVHCVSQTHLCPHGKTNWQNNIRNKEGYHSMQVATTHQPSSQHSSKRLQLS